MICPLLRSLATLKRRTSFALDERRLERLKERGLQLGDDVYFPPSTYVDGEYCYLISIGEGCGFGQQVMLFAHDLAPANSTGRVRVGRVLVHPSCHIGSRTIVMPGVEIGPRTIVAARSVISTDLPPDTVCAGDPARPRATLEEYLEKHRAKLATAKRFPYDEYDIRSLTPSRKDELVSAATSGNAYIVGGRTAELEGRGGTRRTPLTGDQRSTSPREPAPSDT